MSADPQNASYRILIVDDNPKIHEDFRKILTADANGQKHESLAEIEAVFFNEASGSASTLPDVELAYAMQGKDALQLVKDSMAADKTYDMAFVDMRMPPGWNGIETIQQMWAVDPDMQIVICTAYSDHSWTEILERLDQPDNLLILKKPFDSAEVAQMAFAMARKRQLEKLSNTRLHDTENVVQLRTRDLNIAKRESDRLIEAISSIVIQLDADCRVSRWNHTASEVFSLTPKDVVGKSIDELNIDWIDSEASQKFFSQTNADGPVREELGFLASDQDQRIIAMTSYPITNPDLEPQDQSAADQDVVEGFLILGVDLTERKQLEQQLSAAQKLEAVGQLAAGVAHEINTPMQYIGDNINYVKSSFDKIIGVINAFQSLLESAEENKLDLPDELTQQLKNARLKKLARQIPEALQDSEEGVAQVTRIVQAMKQFSHPGEQTATQVNLNEALETTVAVATYEWKYVADVKTELDPELPLITGFPCELNQVFLNLIVNAAHAIAERNGEESPDKGQITLTTSAVDDHVELRIGDTGAGIPESVRDRIFDPFFTTKGVGKGTGQGLSIAYQIITNTHHGEIDFQTDLGVGTTFIIRLPLNKVEDGQKVTAPGIDTSVNYSKSIMSLDSLV